MSKFILGALAAASLLAVSVPALAGYYTYYYDRQGYYHECYNEWDGDQWIKACN